MIEYITIYPSERVIYELDFADSLPPGAITVSSATVGAYKVTSTGALGTAYNSLLASTTCTVNSNTARFTISGAVADERYRVEVVATTNDGQSFKTRLFFKCDSA